MNLPAHHYLDERHIQYEKLNFSTGTDKGASNVADALGYQQSQMVKTLIFETDREERVLVMLGGRQERRIRLPEEGHRLTKHTDGEP